MHASGTDPITRRRFLIRASLMLAGTAAVPLFAACSQPAPAPAKPAAEPTKPTAAATAAPAKPAEAAKPAEQPRAGGELQFVVSAEPPSFDAHREKTFAMLHPTAPHYRDQADGDAVPAGMSQL